MEEVKENTYKKAKQKISFISLIITISIILIFILLLSFTPKNSRDSNENAYVVLGEILSVNEVYPNILLQIENREDGVYGVVLKNNELISKIRLTSINVNEFNDYSVKIESYNEDRNKDFIYVSSKINNGYKYDFYTIDRLGKITKLDKTIEIEDVKKVSVKLTKVNDQYIYKMPVFYYNNYEVSSEVGEYKLSKLSNKNMDTISKKSKIAIAGKYNALPREVKLLKEFPEYIKNVNPYMKDIENKKCIEVDLDNNNQSEYIIYLKKGNEINVGLFDASANFLVSLFSGESAKDINEIVEVADVDDDKIMEIIVINKDKIEVHKYDNGFYY